MAHQRNESRSKPGRNQGWLCALAAPLVCGLMVAACGGATSATTAATSTSTVGSNAVMAASSAIEISSLASPDLGTFLTDSNGRTLYQFEQDQGGRIACTGGCVAQFPPLAVASAALVKSAPGLAGTVSTVMRPDGNLQATYDGAPLYYYSGDSRAGEMNGEGKGGFWFVVSDIGPVPVEAPMAMSGGASTMPMNMAVPGTTTTTTAVPTSSAAGALSPSTTVGCTIPQNNEGDGDSDNNGSAPDRDGCR